MCYASDEDLYKSEVINCECGSKFFTWERDEDLYKSEVINCECGSKSFTWERGITSNMLSTATKLTKFLPTFSDTSVGATFSVCRWFSVTKCLEESVRAVVEIKQYEKLPNLFTVLIRSSQNPNPFFFLSEFPSNVRTNIIDEILLSLAPLRPRSRPQHVYSCLLSYILQTSNPLPLGFVILQRILRSGCVPVPQTHLLLANAWLERRSQHNPIATILSEMNSYGYDLDCNVCNYLISSLCKVEKVEEAKKVLKGMTKAGCIPDLDTYGTIITGMCDLRVTSGVPEMLQEMATVLGLHPRQDVLIKVISALKAKKEIWKAVEMIEYLESKDVFVGFECYESVLEGCLECHQLVLAGKLVMKMTDRGFIPYIKVRQKVVEGLANVSEWELSSAVRQRFNDLGC